MSNDRYATAKLLPIVEPIQMPPYGYQKPQNGFGSIGSDGYQNNRGIDVRVSTGKPVFTGAKPEKVVILEKLPEDTHIAHDARSIAKHLIQLGLDHSSPKDSLQIIKLTYLCHGWMLGLVGKPLSAQPVEAWQYGPVIPDVYNGLKRFGGGHIKIGRLDFNDGNFTESEKYLMLQVFNIYDDFTGIELSQVTHAEETPWYTIWNKYECNTIIPDPLIQEYFSQLAKADDQ